MKILALILGAAIGLAACDAPLPIPTGPIDFNADPAPGHPEVTVRVSDPDHQVIGAMVQGQPMIPSGPPLVYVRFRQGEPNLIDVLWWSSACEKTFSILVRGEGSSVAFLVDKGPADNPDCDAMAVARGVTFNMSRAFQPNEVTVGMGQSGSAGGSG